MRASHSGHVVGQTGSFTNRVSIPSRDRKGDTVERDCQERGGPAVTGDMGEAAGFSDLKRKFPTLNDKLDEDLLVDKVHRPYFR
jgi:hypothetical protein